MREGKGVPMQTKSTQFLIAKAGFLIAVIAGLAALFSGPGASIALRDYRLGIALLRWAAYGGIVAAALSLLGLIVSFRSAMVRGSLWALLGIIISGFVIGLLLHWKHVAESVPRIHDITTDTENPPEFVAVLTLLKKGENSPVYGGAEVAALQRKAYPDIIPLILPIPPDQTFERAIAVGRSLGWQIIDADRNSLRIEAVDTTFWFGFKDDIVIRVGQQDSGSRVDIRSESRVGVSDLGKNAERIRKFLTGMKEWK